MWRGFISGSMVVGRKAVHNNPDCSIALSRMCSISLAYGLECGKYEQMEICWIITRPIASLNLTPSGWDECG